MTTLGMFIETVRTNPLFFVSVVATVIISITLHELAHGYAAVALGDDTPILMKRLTLNPLVHMGLFSIIMMLVMGIAWGSMPINPRKLRGRFGPALVSIAGPITNVLLAIIGLTILGLWQRFGPVEVGSAAENWRQFLFYFGYINVALAMFNMLPIPPLDGSGVLEGFIPGFRQNVLSRVNPMVLLAVIFIGFGPLGEWLFDAAINISVWWLNLIR
ncbi:MAG: site-2 protease family protein [Phycisphaerales bacterium]